MSNQHPYPPHVQSAVARALWEVTEGSHILGWEQLSDDVRDYQHTKAQTALQALWESDQPHKLSADEARTIWNHAIAIRRSSLEAMHDLRMILANHAPDWNGKKQ